MAAATLRTGWCRCPRVSRPVGPGAEGAGGWLVLGSSRPTTSRVSFSSGLWLPLGLSLVSARGVGLDRGSAEAGAGDPELGLSAGAERAGRGRRARGWGGSGSRSLASWSDPRGLAPRREKVARRRRQKTMTAWLTFLCQVLYREHFLHCLRPVRVQVWEENLALAKNLVSGVAVGVSACRIHAGNRTLCCCCLSLFPRVGHRGSLGKRPAHSLTPSECYPWGLPVGPRFFSSFPSTQKRFFKANKNESKAKWDFLKRHSKRGVIWPTERDSGPRTPGLCGLNQKDVTEQMRGALGSS